MIIKELQGSKFLILKTISDRWNFQLRFSSRRNQKNITYLALNMWFLLILITRSAGVDMVEELKDVITHIWSCKSSCSEAV